MKKHMRDKYPGKVAAVNKCNVEMIGIKDSEKTNYKCDICNFRFEGRFVELHFKLLNFLIQPQRAGYRYSVFGRFYFSNLKKYFFLTKSKFYDVPDGVPQKENLIFSYQN